MYEFTILVHVLSSPVDLKAIVSRSGEHHEMNRQQEMKHGGMIVSQLIFGQEILLSPGYDSCCMIMQQVPGHSTYLAMKEEILRLLSI